MLLLLNIHTHTSKFYIMTYNYYYNRNYNNNNIFSQKIILSSYIGTYTFVYINNLITWRGLFFFH